MHDDLGQRMKDNYEKRTRTYLPRRTYTIIRIDGKAFHTYTKGFKKPMDERLMSAMDNTAIELCKQIQGAKMAYVQSDEISILVTDFFDNKTEAWFDGQVQKIVSVSASIATAYFNLFINEPNLAFFDSRVFTIPDFIEVGNYFIWRQKDTIRNATSMVARSLYSHKEIENKNIYDLQKMIFQKGIFYEEDYDYGFRVGRTILKEEGKWKVKHINFIEEDDLGTKYIFRLINELTPKFK